MALTPAPVVVFAHRRPLHLRRVLDALAEDPLAPRTAVTVLCDGPRGISEASDTEAVAREASRRRGFALIEVRTRRQNAGLANSILQGVSEMLALSESIIVLEDDLVPAPSFLEFMNEGLTRFADDERVISIHGYSYPTGLAAPYFLRGADCWGWGTWRRGWEVLETDGAQLLQSLRRQALTREFDLGGSYPFTRMLEQQVAGQVDSWAIRWHASAFLAGRLTLYPGQSLIRNIGADGSGTHTDSTDRFDGELASRAPDLEGLVVEESAIARRAVAAFLGATDRPSVGRFNRARAKVVSVLERGARRRS